MLIHRVDSQLGNINRRTIQSPHQLTMKPKVIARPPKPTKLARLTFAQVRDIPVPADCPYAQLTDLEMIDSLSASELGSLLVKWEERNQTDIDDPIAVSEELVAATVRWRLRGMDMDLAIRKTRTDEVHDRDYRKTAAAIARLEANPIPIEKPILKS